MSELRGLGADPETGGEDFDLYCDDVRIELDRTRDGKWRFWNVVLPGGERCGGSQTLGPDVAGWLEREREASQREEHP